MSPHPRHKQRGAIGLMAAGVLAFVLVFTLLIVDSGRLSLEKRKLQGSPVWPALGPQITAFFERIGDALTPAA